MWILLDGDATCSMVICLRWQGYEYKMNVNSFRCGKMKSFYSLEGMVNYFIYSIFSSILSFHYYVFSKKLFPSINNYHRSFLIHVSMCTLNIQYINTGRLAMCAMMLEYFISWHDEMLCIFCQIEGITVIWLLMILEIIANCILRLQFIYPGSQ